MVAMVAETLNGSMS